MMHHEDRIQRRLGAAHEPAHDVVHVIMRRCFKGAGNAAAFAVNPGLVERVLSARPARSESLIGRLAEDRGDDTLTHDLVGSESVGDIDLCDSYSGLRWPFHFG